MAGHHAHPWNTRQIIRADGIAKLDCYALARLLAQLLHLFNGDDFALANDRHTLAYLLDVAHDMRTHEDGLATRLFLQQELVECALQKRVEARSWLVEDQHIGIAHEGQHDADLLAHAFGVAFQLSFQLDIEARYKVVQQHGFASLQTREVVDDLLAGHLPRQAHVTGQVADALV